MSHPAESHSGAPFDLAALTKSADMREGLIRSARNSFQDVSSGPGCLRRMAVKRGNKPMAEHLTNSGLDVNGTAGKFGRSYRPTALEEAVIIKRCRARTSTSICSPERRPWNGSNAAHQ